MVSTWCVYYGIIDWILLSKNENETNREFIFHRDSEKRACDIHFNSMRYMLFVSFIQIIWHFECEFFPRNISPSIEGLWASKLSKAISTNISDYIVPFVEEIRWLPLYNLSTKMKIMIFEIDSLKTVRYRWILFIIISQYFWNGTRLLHQVTLVLINSLLNYLHPSKTFTETAAIILNGSLLYVQVAFIFKCFPQSHFIGSVAT